MEIVLYVIVGIAVVGGIRYVAWRFGGSGKRMSDAERETLRRKWEAEIQAEEETKTPEEKEFERVAHERWLAQYGPQVHGSGTTPSPGEPRTRRPR